MQSFGPVRNVCAGAEIWPDPSHYGEKLMVTERLFRLLAEVPAVRRYTGRHRAPETMEYADAGRGRRPESTMPRSGE
jgi:hypothetical protein